MIFYNITQIPTSNLKINKYLSNFKPNKKLRSDEIHAINEVYLITNIISTHLLKHCYYIIISYFDFIINY